MKFTILFSVVVFCGTLEKIAEAYLGVPILHSESSGTFLFILLIVLAVSDM